MRFIEGGVVIDQSKVNLDARQGHFDNGMQPVV